MAIPIPYGIISNMPFAAQELASYLEALTGVCATNQQSDFTYRIHSSGKDGEAFTVTISANEVVILAASDRAAVYGVYTFLEKHIGCHFYAQDCESLPAPPNIQLAVGTYSYAPAFAYREVYWRGALDGRFALKLGLNSARANIPPAWGGKIMFLNYSHTFEQLVPPDVWYDTHPEYFSLIDGARQKEKSQLCLTNNEVLAICIKKVRQWMRDNPDCRIFSVAQNDWYSPCQCDTCQEIDALEGSHTGSMIAFVNAVADAVKDEFPQNFIHTFAYLYTRKAPKYVRPRANVIVRLCSIECCFSHPMDACPYAIDEIDVETTNAQPFTVTGNTFPKDLEQWSDICQNLYIWDYTTNFSNYLQPFPNLQVLAPNLQLMRARGVKGVFEQGNYAPGEASAFAPLKIYLLGKLLWSPEEDVPALTMDFLQAYYGASAAPMLSQYLQLLEEAVKSSHIGIFDGADAAYLSDDLLAKGHALFRSALDITPYPLYRKRILREELSLRYMQLVRLPLDAPQRELLIDDFYDDVDVLDIQELFERRDLAASIQCMKNSRWVKDRSGVPYRVYRL